MSSPQRRRRTAPVLALVIMLLPALCPLPLQAEGDTGAGPGGQAAVETSAGDPGERRPEGPQGAAASEQPEGGPDAGSDVVHELEDLFDKRKKAAEEGRVLGGEELEKKDAVIDRVIDGAPPRYAKDLKSLRESVQGYRTTMIELNQMGGAVLGTIKSRRDLDRRLDKVIRAKKQLDRVISNYEHMSRGAPANIHGLELERAMLENVGRQLEFYRKHWGKWEIDRDGTPSFDVDPGELDDYNRTVDDNARLHAEMLRSIEQSSQQNLDRLKGL